MPSSDPARHSSATAKKLWKTSEQMIAEAKTRLAEEASQVVRGLRQPDPAVTPRPRLRSAPPPGVAYESIDSFEGLTRDQVEVSARDSMEVRGMDRVTVEGIDRSSARTIDGVPVQTERPSPSLPPFPGQTSTQVTWNELVKTVRPFIGWIIFLFFIVISQLAR